MNDCIVNEFLLWQKNNVTIKVGSDTKEASKGIDSLTSKDEHFCQRCKNSAPVNAMVKLGVAVSGLGTAFSALTGAAKAVSATVADLTNIYKVQAMAETQLETAARNNPYLNGANVTNLKNYASQLQSISVYGDEQLSAAGRTESEIMDIMSASIDVAASGSMSLESAVKNLNQTYAGTSGQLGVSLANKPYDYDTLQNSMCFFNLLLS